MISRIERDFPRLVELGYVPTSLPDRNYNCIAFTLGDLERWWWPPVHEGMSSSYWPQGVPCHETLEAFIEMYRQQGFEPCTSAEPEAEYVKIAIYVEPKEHLPVHAAIQLLSGRWLSKMADHEDFIHTFEGLTGPPHFFDVGRVLRCQSHRVPDGLKNILAAYQSVGSGGA